MRHWKIGVALAVVVGLALTLGSILYVGAGGLVQSVQRVGLTGFTVYTLYNLIVFLPLGWAWWSVAPGAPRGQPFLFPWGRVLRDAASDVLPFAQVGGLIVGVRAVQHRGVPERLAIASQIADLTTEMASQIVYTLFGVAMLIAILSHNTDGARLLSTALLAVAVGVVTLAAFVALQNRGVDVAGAVAGRWLESATERADAVKATLKSIYAEPRRLISGVCLHGLAWTLTGVGSWIALQFMGLPIPLWKVLTLDSLMAAVRSVAFMTPGGLGFQEGAYVLVAPLFGLPPEAALSVSLLRRVKDLVVGVPAMLVWQFGEVGGKRGAEAAPRLRQAP